MVFLRVIFRRIILGGTILAAGAYVAWAFSARQMADLAPEHRVEFSAEFQARHEASTDWQAYLAIEDRLAEELISRVEALPRAAGLLDRHSSQGLTHPESLAVNWNRSYEARAESPRGVAVLLHGLSDSPYSMRATAETFLDVGFSVVVPRMPGHGFAVGGLRQSRWEDWTATVRLAVARARELVDEDEPLVMVGYSNGALLATDYALRCEHYSSLGCPDRLVLFSPAFSVSRAGALTNLHSLVSWLPLFEKFQWLSVSPEIDPFKFTSFPKRAAWEIFQVSRRMQKELSQPSEAAKLPPVLTFLSVVDNTVSAEAVTRDFYAALPDNGSKMVIYDVNRHDAVLFGKVPEDPLAAAEASAPFIYDVSVIRNRGVDKQGVEVATLLAGAREFVHAERDQRWPDGFFSLSHIALTFRADDSVYGDGKGDSELPFSLGALAPRGEAGLLKLNSDYFLRARYNPFYEIQAGVLARWLESI